MSAVPSSPDPASLADRSVDLVRQWLAESTAETSDAAAGRLAGVLRDPLGPAFTLGFVDGVVRPEDAGVAGRELGRIAPDAPSFLPWWQRAAIRVGGGVAPVIPWPVVPVARRVLRSMVSHLLIDSRPEKLGASIEKLRQDGVRLNLNLLGEAVLGEEEAARRLAGIRGLLERDDVDYVSIKVSAIASGLSMWAFDAEVARVVDRLRPVYRAAAAGAPKFINLDMEEYRDLDLTLAVFMTLLDEPELRGLEAGIVLQAYLPDALPAMRRLQEWASARVDAGGAPIKVRVVKGANLAMERVDAALHDWPLATWSTKRETDTAYLALLDWALTPERTRAVRIGVAGHNLFDLAWTWLRAEERGVTDRLDVEMLLGMAAGGADAVRRTTGRLILYTPVVDPGEFDVAIAYLVRRLEENADDENFMSSLFELAGSRDAFELERGRFFDALDHLGDPVAETHRVQNRSAERPRALHDVPFENTPDTDPSIAANREWATDVRRASRATSLGEAVLAASAVDDGGILDRIVDTVARAAGPWGEQSGDERARILERAAAALAALRGDLLEIAAAETGKTLAEGDPEVSEAIDFARYYATLARELDEIEAATPVPARVTVVASPWNFPIAIPVGMVLAALAAGSGVVFKPAPQARRTGAVVAEALWQAGIPRELLAFVDLDEDALGRRLIENPRVERVLLTGSWDTARLFRSWRPDLSLQAETSGKNAVVVTPAADLDLAVADVVRSAFGHAGQKCSAASLVILVGSVGKSERFLTQLRDAVSSLRVGWPDRAETQMGPIIEPAAGKLLGALTQVGEGESWLVEPRALDDSGRLWSPGVRDDVSSGSEFHLTEYFGPVLGIMRAATLEQAIEMQNAVPYGLTAGIHSLDEQEIAEWLDRVEAGNLYVNRGITGAIVRRQPFGGWKRSNVGGGAKAGGPNHLIPLVGWIPAELPRGNTIALTGIGQKVATLIEAATSDLPYDGFEFVRQAARSDEKAWNAEFG
ncbi:MAG: bifunctional proline dehydrogenase/L-glutamate gamma-semialdehyde dehydrogenase, partial [Naasia sp.]